MNLPIRARLLAHCAVTHLRQLPRFSEQELLGRHGVGPKAMRLLREALAQRGLAFAQPDSTSAVARDRRSARGQAARLAESDSIKMKATYTTTVWKDKEMNATGLEVPADVMAALGKGKRLPVKVRLNGHMYRTTTAVMGGVCMLPLSAENRGAAGVAPGEQVEVTLELDLAPRTVVVPKDLAAALSKKRGVKAKFDALSVSARKEYVRQVESAKAEETRARRIAKIVAQLDAG